MSTPTPPDQPGHGSLFALLTAQRRFIYLVVTLVSFVGIWSATTLPSAIYPELTFERITVVAEGSALGPRQMLFDVTRPIEEAVSVVLGVTRVQSRSIRGGSETTITFAPGTDMQYALQLVQASVNQVAGDLPMGLDIQMERMTPSIFPILSYNLEGGDPATLYDIARYQIRPLISRVPGVARVDVMGSDIREIEVIADPARLVAQGMTYEDLATAIRAATTVTAVGRVPSNYRQYLIVSATEAHAAEDIANLVVGRGLRVRDLATVLPGTEDHVREISGDGHPAALLNITRQIGGNTVGIADSIAVLAQSLAATLPPGVHLKATYDQAALVRDAMATVRDAMLIGAALAVIVLLLFLRHARITAISASSIPLTLAITVAIMALAGQTFNLMTLGAMAIAIGLVIDDAVVVTENIVRHLRLTPDRTRAVREAVSELIWPVTTSTITTVVVFLPLGLLTGVEGQFFRTLSATLTIAVLVSLVLALSLIPLLSAQYLTVADTDTDEPASHRGLLAGLERRIDALSVRYAQSLHAVLHHPRMAALIAAGLVVTGVMVYRVIGTGFLPEMDEGAFVLDYWTPGGTALSETDRQLRIIEQILAETPEVVGSSRRTGAEMGLFATQLNRGDIAVRLTAPGKRTRTSEEIIDDIRTRINAAVPRVRIEFVQILADVIGDLAGGARPVEIRLFGPDLDSLEAYAQRLAVGIGTIDGIEDLYDGISEPSEELAMHIDAAKADRAGLTPEAISAQVAGALLGRPAGIVRLDDRSIGVRVRAPDSVRFEESRLGSLPVLSSAGASATALAAFASFTPVETRAELLRQNQQQIIDMTSDISGRSLGDVMKDVKRVVAEIPPTQGIRMELAGQYASQQAAFRSLVMVLAMAALSVVAVMVVQFRSFTEPFVVLLAAPISFVGALALLEITGTPLNVSSFMGLILLVGLIVKNGIILLDFTHRRMAEAGIDLETALTEAGRIRLRPILMTTLCTLFGLLPLALGLGAGSEMQKPLALAVIGGLALSTPITLYVVPTLLVAIRGRAHTITRSAP
ncbi:MAG: efflux RND transporter permease subunit [Gemmatimonadetes bacterium]|nr:efflux RND transporter permease subunit [Gemmatimonadota bacterium]